MSKQATSFVAKFSSAILSSTSLAKGNAMKTRSRTNTVLSFATVAVATLALAASTNAAVVVTPDHISTNPGVVGTLVAIDVPYHLDTPPGTLPYTGGPNWSVDADDGFMTVDQAVQETWTSGRWEPDGTPTSENLSYQTYPNGDPNVSYIFNLASSGIDIPDGSIVNAVYATWATRSNLFGRYNFSEGAASGSVDITQSSNPANNLGLDWTDDVAGSHTAPFELIFSGPITVEGGDGFTVNVNRYTANAASIDAVVIDVTLPTPPAPEPSTLVLAALGVVGLVGTRRRRNR